MSSWRFCSGVPALVICVFGRRKVLNREDEFHKIQVFAKKTDVEHLLCCIN